MANFFKNQQSAKTMSERDLLEAKYKSSRGNLLIVVLLTVVNMVMLLANAGSYFLFSAFIPYYMTLIGMDLCGKMPAEYYGEYYGQFEFWDQSFLISMIVIAVFILLLYLLSWFLSKNHKVGWLIFSLVFFSVDTLCMILLLENPAGSILDILLHVLVIYYLISGIRAHYKLMKLPPEEVVSDAAPIEIEIAPVENTENTENVD